MTYVYIRDEEGFVAKKKKAELLPNEQIITEEEYNEISGENYCNVTFGHGGSRKNAGRKPKSGVVLKFQVRVSEKEKEFLNYARSHNLNYDDLMQG